MEVCPAGFFCIDKNTTMLMIVGLVILVAYYIGNNNTKFIEIQNRLDSNQELMKYKLGKYENKIGNLSSHNKSLEKENLLNSLYMADKEININKHQQRVFNPLVAPERSSPFRVPSLGVPINIPTRGHSSGYQQVGALIQNDGSGNNQKILPLYGEQTYPGSRQWKYYTGSDGYQSIKLPVVHKNKDCQDTYGCDEIYDGTLVNVNGHDSQFKANIYKLDAPKYIPYV